MLLSSDGATLTSHHTLRSNGVLVTLATLIVLEALNRTVFRVSTPGAIILLPVAYAAFTGGLRAGLISATLMFLYALYFFAVPGQFLHYTGSNLQTIFVLALIALSMVGMIGRLKRRIEDLSWHNQLILHSAGEGICGLDAHGMITFLNPAAATMCGWRVKELIGQPIGTLLREALPSATADAAGSGHTITVVTDDVCWRKDGTSFPVEYLRSPMWDQHHMIGAVITFKDITERKRIETALQRSAERLQHLRAIDQAILLRNPLIAITQAAVGHIIHLIPTTRVALLLIDSSARTLSPIAYQMRDDLAPPLLRPAPLAMIDEMLEQLRRGQIYHVADVAALAKPPVLLQMASAEHVRAFFVVPILANGELVATLNVGSDTPDVFTAEHLEIAYEVGEQISIAIQQVRMHEQIEDHTSELEQRVIERTAQLETTNKELETFSYSVSHDLRTPLRSIDGFSQALLEDYADQLDPQGQDYLQRVRVATQRMAQLIDDLLNLARVTRSQLHYAQVDLSAHAATIANELQRADPDRQVDMVIAPGLVAYGDDRLLQLVLENLLANAWKFTSKCAYSQIEFGAAPYAGQRAYFVRDTGAGFDMAYADRLFGAFQRLHAMNEFAGTGVGLATVQRIIHRHGGRIWAESAVDAGATFFFVLQQEAS